MSLLIQNARLQKQEQLTDILCEGDKITQIAPQIPVPRDGTVIDAKGRLVTPSFIDPHIHLDKVNVVEVVRPNSSGTLQEAIEIMWEEKRDYTNEAIVQRSEEVIKRGVANGTLAMRTHVDVDTIGGLKPLEGILALREKYKSVIDLQIVAFPQEGIVKDPGCEKLMDQAMELGADIVGGMPHAELSPADSLAHVQFCFQLAVKHNADVDMHVDESDDPFYRTLEMVADETIKVGWEGRVTAGHTCALSAYDDHYAEYVIDKVKKAGIHMITNPATNLVLQGRGDKYPIRRGLTRVKQLLEAGINVCYGQDCVKDTFYPLGGADMLKMANLTCHAAQMTLPHEIDKLLDMITVDANKIMGATHYGLDIGCKANLVVLGEETVLDAIRLTSPRPFVIKNGKVIAQSVLEVKLAF